MNIGVDLHVLSGIYQGSRRYLESLYSRIIGSDAANDYHLFFGRAAKEIPDWALTASIDTFRHSHPIPRLLWDSVNMYRKYRLDLFHFQYIAPPQLFSRSVVTIHDVLFESHPQYFRARDLIKLRTLVPITARHCAHIVTVSDYCKHQIVERYGVPEQKITITPNAVDSAIFTNIGRLNSKQLVLERYGISDFILSVGRLEPRKNYKVLFAAYRSLLAVNSALPKLVIVGQRDFRFEDIFESIENDGLEKNIFILEDVSDTDLPHLYRAASLFVFPSHAEGFGIPLLEAMASGCPVISSNSTSMPEVVGDSALTFDPTDPCSLAEAIDSVLVDKDLAQRMSLGGMKRASNFSWDRSAKILSQLYEQLNRVG